MGPITAINYHPTTHALTNGGHGTRPTLIGHPPDLAYVEAEAGAGHLEVGPDTISVHGILELWAMNNELLDMNIMLQTMRRHQSHRPSDWMEVSRAMFMVQLWPALLSFQVPVQGSCELVAVTNPGGTKPEEADSLQERHRTRRGKMDGFEWR